MRTRPRQLELAPTSSSSLATFPRHHQQEVVGDQVGVGPLVDSCGACRWCEAGEEYHCQRGHVDTYNSLPLYGNCETSTGHTMGGYSGHHTVPER